MLPMLVRIAANGIFFPHKKASLAVICTIDISCPHTMVFGSMTLFKGLDSFRFLVVYFLSPARSASEPSFSSRSSHTVNPPSVEQPLWALLAHLLSQVTVCLCLLYERATWTSQIFLIDDQRACVTALAFLMVAGRNASQLSGCRREYVTAIPSPTA